MGIPKRLYLKKYYALVKNMLSSLMILKNGVIVYANKTLLKTSGYELNELLGSNFIDHVHPNEKEKVQEYYQKRITGQEAPESYRSRAVTKSSEVVYVDVKVEKIHFGNEDAVMVVMNNVNEQVRALANLEQSKQTLSTLFDNLPGMAYRCPNTPEWSMEFINEGVRALTGYEPHEVINDRVVSYGRIIHPDDRKHVWGKVQESVEKEQAFELEYRIIDKTGAVKWVWERGRCVNCKQSEEGILEGFVSDITSRKKAEKDLQDKEIHYRKLFESASDAILMMDGFSFINCNQATLSVFGYDNKNQIIGKTPQQLSPQLQPGGELSETLANEYMEKALQGTSNEFDWQHLKKDGSKFDAHITLNAVEIEGKKYVQSIVRDITERKQVQKRIQQSEERFRFLSDITFEGIIIHKNGIIQDVNKSFEKMSGYSKEEAVGEDIFKGVFAPSDYVKARKNISKAYASPYRIEVKRKNGSSFWAELEGRNIIHKNE